MSQSKNSITSNKRESKDGERDRERETHRVHTAVRAFNYGERGPALDVHRCCVVVLKCQIRICIVLCLSLPYIECSPNSFSSNICCTCNLNCIGHRDT